MDYDVKTSSNPLYSLVKSQVSAFKDFKSVTLKNAIAIHRALISVSDKDKIKEFASALVEFEVEIIASGGTAKYFQSFDIPVVEVSQYTQFPEILAGRVKTLHPKIFGGILQGGEPSIEELKSQNIFPIDLVVVNLYPFTKTIQRPHSLEEAIENIDIGGVSLIRAAAKNYQHVVVITDPCDYQTVLTEFKTSQKISYATRLQLAKKAFALTAFYENKIAEYFSHINNSNSETNLPDRLILQSEQGITLRYGENPHQKAALYPDRDQQPGTIAFAKLLQGKQLSYNNLLDADTAWQCVQGFEQPTCVIVKHANPCGVAQASSPEAAYHLAYQVDMQSAFGGIIAFNRTLDQATAKAILKTQFAEVILAPEISEPAQMVLADKPNIRVLACGLSSSFANQFELRSISGGVLLQDQDQHSLRSDELKMVTKRHPTQEELEDLIFAWRVVKFVKSNAIVIAKNNKTLGIGAGQPSRIYSIKLASHKAEDANFSLKDAVMASDAFFPFRDNVDKAAKIGIRAVIQPGGSIRDEEIIKAADEHDIAMVFTGIRHFRH